MTGDSEHDLPDFQMDALVVRHEPVTRARLESALGANVLADVVVHDLDVVVQTREADGHVRTLVARVLPRRTFGFGGLLLYTTLEVIDGLLFHSGSFLFHSKLFHFTQRGVVKNRLLVQFIVIFRRVRHPPFHLLCFGSLHRTGRTEAHFESAFAL